MGKRRQENATQQRLAALEAVVHQRVQAALLQMFGDEGMWSVVPKIANDTTGVFRNIMVRSASSEVTGALHDIFAAQLAEAEAAAQAATMHPGVLGLYPGERAPLDSELEQLGRWPNSARSAALLAKEHETEELEAESDTDWRTVA